MDTYVALFRGINITGRNILPMKELVAILERVGCSDVTTYIQSGNAVFQTRRANTSKLAEEISARIREDYGFEPKVLLLNVSELEEAIENNPFEMAKGKALHLFFLESTPAQPDLDGLEKLRSDSEAFKLVRNVFYLHTPDGFARSKLPAKVERAFGVPATARNWNTVNRLTTMARQA